MKVKNMNEVHQNNLPTVEEGYEVIKGLTSFRQK
jgi:hypothetical protein